MAAKRTPSPLLLDYFWEHVGKPTAHDGWPGRLNGGGYGTLTIGGRKRDIHVWACEIAHGECPVSGWRALHLCRVARCFWGEHLEWGPQSKNIGLDRVRDGTVVRGEHIHGARLTAIDVPEIRAAVAAGESRASVARRYGVSDTAIRHIVHRRTWDWL